ncbi:MAG: hypothetical protein J6M31_06790 [Bacteroidales bacterium]|nr:hypothetical protein [Bacteroidales bacterium]
MKKCVIVLLLLGASLFVHAQTPVQTPDLSQVTQVAPAYFGPNAFPVPDVPEARLTGEFRAELSGDLFWGQGVPFADDLTYGPRFMVQLPLWTKRAALTVWMPIVEWWSYSPAIAARRRLTDFPDGGKGIDSGDVYVSTDFHVLTEKGWRPDILIRAVLKTASGNTYGQARYYDAPGYFFDASIGKSLYLNGFLKELRLVVSGGFLCWQTDRGRQNDAWQYGVLGIVDTRAFRLSAQLAGYSGWEGDGDRPLTVKGVVEVPIGAFAPFAAFEYGLHDYPFSHLRAGVKYRLKKFGDSRK